MTTIERALDPVRRVLIADLRPVKRMGDGEQGIDPGLQAYVEERFVARLTDPIVQEIAKLAGVATPSTATSAVRAVLLGAVSAFDPTLAPQDRPLVRIIDAAIMAFASALNAEAQGALPPAPFAALEQRSALVRDALLPKTQTKQPE